MGVAHSTEATLTAVVLAGILGLGYHYYSTTPGAGVNATTTTTGSPTDTNSVKKSSKKKKKKGLEGNTNTSLASSTSQLVVDSSNNIPGQFDQPLTPTKVKKPKKKASSAKHVSHENPPPPPSSSTINPQPPASPKPANDDVVQNPSTMPSTEGSWTRVVSRRKQGADSTISVDVTTSDAGLTSSVTGNSSPVEEAEEESSLSSSKDKLQTLAEKLVPKAPSTQVDELSIYALNENLYPSVNFNFSNQHVS